jgi:hypothetical protein
MAISSHGISTMCLPTCHTWRKLNQSTFEPLKENIHIVSHHKLIGEPFILLGIMFDPKLSMQDYVVMMVDQVNQCYKATL